MKREGRSVCRGVISTGSHMDNGQDKILNGPTRPVIKVDKKNGKATTIRNQGRYSKTQKLIESEDVKVLVWEQSVGQ